MARFLNLLAILLVSAAAQEEYPVCNTRLAPLFERCQMEMGMAMRRDEEAPICNTRLGNRLERCQMMAMGRRAVDLTPRDNVDICNTRAGDRLDKCQMMSMGAKKEDEGIIDRPIIDRPADDMGMGMGRRAVDLTPGDNVDICNTRAGDRLDKCQMMGMGAKKEDEGIIDRPIIDRPADDMGMGGMGRRRRAVDLTPGDRVDICNTKAGERLDKCQMMAKGEKKEEDEGIIDRPIIDRPILDMGKGKGMRAL